MPGRNSPCGYNYKFLGSSRIMNSGAYENFPVRLSSFNNRLWNGCNDPRAKPVLREPPSNGPASWRRETL